LILLYPAESELPPQELKKTADSLRNSLATTLGTNPSIAVGIGRIYAGPEGIKTSYHEARQSIIMGSRVFGASCLTYFGDLGVYRLLFNLQGSDDLGAFYHETLGSLLEYDQKTNSDLIHTLQIYFASCGSVARAAEELQLHRNSLLYRLQRVKEISGLDLEDAEARLAMQLALHIGDILEDAAVPK
jgi:purine catabolism regulator